MHAVDFYLEQRRLLQPAGADTVASRCPRAAGRARLSILSRAVRARTGRWSDIASWRTGSPRTARWSGAPVRKTNWPVPPSASPICTHWPAGWPGARVYIGNDSGIAHLAAAVGTPVVALFGPTDPRVWAPRGRDVRVVQGAGDDGHPGCRGAGRHPENETC